MAGGNLKNHGPKRSATKSRRRSAPRRSAPPAPDVVVVFEGRGIRVTVDLAESLRYAVDDAERGLIETLQPVDKDDAHDQRKHLRWLITNLAPHSCHRWRTLLNRSLASTVRKEESLLGDAISEAALIHYYVGIGQKAPKKKLEILRTHRQEAIREEARKEDKMATTEARRELRRETLAGRPTGSRDSPSSKRQTDHAELVAEVNREIVARTKDDRSRSGVSYRAAARAVAARLGKKPETARKAGALRKRGGDDDEHG